ncbi:MAG TPA: DUF6496 domain-containing protein [Sediminibacterium sp.]|jgi:hypothetical protein
MARKYSKGAQKKVEKAMHERKHGTLKSGRSGKKVTSRKQAIAIGLSEAREEGKKVPSKKTAKKTTSRKKTTRKKTASKKTASKKTTRKSAPKKTSRKKTASKKSSRKKSAS